MNLTDRLRFRHAGARRAVTLWLGLALYLVLPAEAQELPFRHYQLPSPTATSIFQDSLGYMWFGVRDVGLVRYDGRKMEVVPQLADGRIEVVSIAQDGQGRLWLSTDMGLLISESPLALYPHTELPRFIEELNGTPLSQAFEYSSTLTRHGDGSIWFGTPRNGIIRYRYHKGRKLKADTIRIGTISANGHEQYAAVTALASSENGVMWAAFENGMIRRFPGYGIRSEIAAEPARGYAPPTNKIFAVNGTLYGGTIGGTVWKLENQALIRFAGPFNGPVTDITGDQAGRLWISTGGAGIMVVDPATLERYWLNPANGMLDGQVGDTHIDREGNIWIAQYTGLSKLKSDYRAFTIFSSKRHGRTQAALPSPEVSSVLPLKGTDIFPGALLVAGTTDGLAFLTIGQTQTVGFEHGLTSNIITSVSRDRTGNILLGTQSGVNVIARYNGQIPPYSSGGGSVNLFGRSARIYSYHLGAVSKVVEYMMPSKSGIAIQAVWAVADTAIFCCAGGQWLAFDEMAGLPRSGNVDIYSDSLGYVYIANRKRGLYRSLKPLAAESLDAFKIHNARMFDFPRMQRVEDNVFAPVWDTGEILSRLMATRNGLYVGTDAGLFHLRQDAVKPVRILPDLSHRIEAMAVHGTTGNTWIGTNAGLVEANLALPSILQTVTKNDGIASNGTWSGAMAVHCDTEGNVYQATGNGLTVYSPSMDMKNSVAPSVVLELAEFTQDDFGNNEVAIGYLALSFANEDEVRFRTRLVGYDSAWSEPEAAGEIRFTNLLAVLFEKEFVFEVVACNNDGVWSEIPARYAFSVMPPWWFRWYSLVLFPFFLMAVFAGWNRLKTAKLAKQNRRLENIVIERTKEISEKARELETLDGIVKTINQETTLDRVLDTIVSEAMALFPSAERGAFIVWDDAFKRYIFMASVGYDPNALSEIRLSEEELYARYIDTSERIGTGLYVARDTSHLAAQEKFADVPVAASMLIMAQEHEGTPEALLVLANMHAQDAFDLSDVQKLGRFREHAVSAISKAQVLEVITRKNNEIVRQQEQLVTQEKLASLGALTAGIAHEIKNPLNFVTNFAKLSGRMVGELDEHFGRCNGGMNEDDREDVTMIIANLKQNISKIGEHGTRADNIVKNMMLHSRGTSNDRQRVKINSLVDEYVNLSFHGMRAQNADFNITIEREYDEAVGEATVVPHDLSRVVLNVVNNGCYAAWKKKLRLNGEFKPTIRVETMKRRNMFEIHVRDNGDGIPDDIREKIFEPFFTTKPTGEGTGLGLSMSYEIVVKEHGGEFRVDSEPGEWTKFIIAIPAVQ